MEERIINFVQILRRAGLPVSPGETIDAVRGSSLTGLEKDSFFYTLKATLVKNPSHEKSFEKLFNLFFNTELLLHHEGSFAHINFMPTTSGLEGRPGTGTTPGRRRPIGEVGQNVAQLVQAGNAKAFRELAREAVASLQEIDQKEAGDLRELERRVRVYLEWKIAADLLDQHIAKTKDRDEQECSALLDCWSGFEKILQAELEKFLLKHFQEQALEAIVKRENLKELDFYELSENQSAIMKHILTKLGRKLASRLSFRLKKSKNGYLDLKATLRKSMATGGIPLRPGFRKRSYDRPDLAVFCDISGSVARFSEFMLQLVYSMQRKYVNVRSYVFVDRVDEISDLFKEREIEEAFRQMYNSTTSSKTAYSNYGAVWEDILQRFAGNLTKKTTLLILGDARNNYYRDNRELLEHIGAMVKSIVWFNPEPAPLWNMEDSIMKVYGESCQQVFECRNLNQLERAVKEIF